MLSSWHHSEIVPVLETERLTLRGHRPDDFADCAAMWADPQVTRYIGGKPLSKEECWSRLLRYVGHWAWLGFGYWVAEERATGRLVGEIGFADYKRNLEPSLTDVPEIGWVLASHAHGRGLATEAVHAAVAWGDAHFSLLRTMPRTAAQTACIIAPENVASIRVAVKCGYREFKSTSYKGKPTLIFVREPRTSA